MNETGTEPGAETGKTLCTDTPNTPISNSSNSNKLTRQKEVRLIISHKDLGLCCSQKPLSPGSRAGRHKRDAPGGRIPGETQTAHRQQSAEKHWGRTKRQPVEARGGHPRKGTRVERSKGLTTVSPNQGTRAPQPSKAGQHGRAEEGQRRRCPSPAGVQGLEGSE